MSKEELTPLMRQYWEIKRGYQDTIVFFRVGDFYEMFYQDAEEASRILNIALTSRDKNKADPVPLCGIPYHASTTYIAKLLQAGRTVALCDQVEDAKLAKGLVRREVVRLYTPGTLTDSELLSLDTEDLLRRLYHQETVRLFSADTVAFECSCSRMRCDGLLQSLGLREAESILEDEGQVEITCEFCDAQYRYDAVDVAALFMDNTLIDGDTTLH